MLMDKEHTSVERIRIFEDTIHQLEQKLRASENTLTMCHSILEQNIAGVYVIKNDRFSYVNQSFADIFGYSSPQEIISKKKFIELIAPEHRDLVVENVRKRTRGEIDAIRYEFTGLRKDGSRIVVEVHGRSVMIEGKRTVIGVIIDATDNKRMNTLAFYDSLTRLPNRALFHDRFSQAIARARRNNEKIALLFIDLDRFKTVNDSFGHRAGDHVLQESALRLKALLRDSDTVARLGGDEFAAILTGAVGHDIAAQTAIKMAESLEAPISFSGHSIVVSASIGISLFPQDGAEIDVLLHIADTAMYEAKKRGKHTYHFAS